MRVDVFKRPSKFISVSLSRSPLSSRFIIMRVSCRSVTCEASAEFESLEVGGGGAARCGGFDLRV